MEIVKRLRAMDEEQFWQAPATSYHDCQEAATEIERLRDDLREATQVLRAIATDPSELNPGYDHYTTCRETARMAAENFARRLRNE